MRDIVTMIGTFLGRMSVKFDQAVCRHTYHWAFRDKHTFLRCTKCLHETAGWDMRDIPPPRRVYEGDPASRGVRSRSK